MIKYTLLLILTFLFACSKSLSNKKDRISANTTQFMTDKSAEFDCIFKTNQNRDCWTRIGSYPIDTSSEAFACHLKGNDFKNIVIAKYIGDNGAFANETAFVLWTESKGEYVKEFYTSGKLDVLEKQKRSLNWESLRLIADSVRIDTVASNPKLKMWVSHDIGFAVQYSTSSMFFCDRLQDNEWKASIDQFHPKVIFWNELTNLLKPTTDR